MADTILVVDDSSSVRKMVEFALKSKGYGAALAVDGVDALDALQRGTIPSGGSQFALVVLDINMPRLDGLSLLQTIRERPEWADLPVLMLTTEGQEADRDRAMAMGATDYMSKPFKPTELLERVQRLLAAKP
jgi:two-component system chemotaxis response regulator CheY